MKKKYLMIMLLILLPATILSGCITDEDYGFVTKNVLFMNGTVHATYHSSDSPYKDASTEITFVFREKGNYTLFLAYGEGGLYEQAINVTIIPYSLVWSYSDVTDVSTRLQKQGAPEELYLFEGRK